MSNNFEDPPSEFPNSDTEENSQNYTSDTEPVTSDKNEWTPELLQLMVDHGLDPNSFENVEDEAEGREADETGEILTHHLSC